MLEKAHREDQQLDVRPARRSERDRRTDGDDEGVNKKPSALFLAQGSARESAVAREGTRGSASELPHRAELEGALGVDLSRVKAHTGGEATAAADQLGAEAYAMRDENAIVFGGANPSKELVAHEVIHTLQQGGSGAVGQDEAEADAHAAAIAGGGRVDATEIKSGGGAVRKKEKSQLAKIFDDYLKGAEKAAQERYGDEPEIQDPTGELSPDGRLTSKDSAREVSGGLLDKKVTETTTTRKGVTDITHDGLELEELEDAISDAQVRVSTVEAETRVASFVAAFDKQSHQQALKSLDSQDLDPKLVAAKRGLLQQQVDAADAKIAALEKELATLAHTKKLLEQAKAEAAASSARLKDSLPQLLVDAEESFRGTSKTQKRTFGFNVLAGTVEESIEAERTESHEAGSETVGGSRSKSTKIGHGVTTTDKRGKSSSRTDADGNTTSKSSSVEDTHSLKMGEDGSIGVGRGKKLSGEIENKYGKATGGAGLDGAITANIVELPHEEGTPAIYAVVTTIDVAIALEAGLAKETDKKKKVKGSASLSVSAGAAAQLTTTHVLDQAEVKRYLASLDAIANGGKAPEGKREFDVLYKAVQGLGTVDEILNGFAATLGGSDAAKDLQPDESVELTAKVSGGFDGGASAGPLGASGGAAGELYRSMKIGKVTDNAGRELVEVALAFGDSSEVHGKLTGTAFGVSVSRSGKDGSSNDQSVTFRLDPAADDYAVLYDEIVGTLSPWGLLELRKSRRFAQHVQAYSSKQTQTGERTTEVSGAVGGVKDTSTHARSSSRGMTDGVFTAEEHGEQGRRTGFSVGPLELLRRQQTDAGTLSMEGGMANLDISETTEQAWLGKFDPSLEGLLRSESPAKAAEKALLETNKKLEGFFLDASDIETLRQKAMNEPEAWGNVWIHADSYHQWNLQAPWEQLRKDLVKPKRTDDPAVPLELRRELALGTAVTDFMAKGGEAKGADYIRVALRSWRKVGGADGTPGGTMYEFPADVSAEKYKKVRRDCKGLELDLATFVGDQEKGIEPGLAHIADLQVDLAKVLKSVEDSYGFESERARLEMVTELRGFAADITKIRREFVKKCQGKDVSSQSTMEVVTDHKEQIGQLEATLETSKVSERWLLKMLENRIEWHSGQERANEMKPLVTNLCELYDHHIILVKELRAIYKAACLDGSGKVSARVAGERGELDIDHERFAAVFRTYLRSHRFSVPDNAGVDPEKRIENYRYY